MANEIITKFSASAALNYGTILNGLANGAVAWCDPVTDASPSAPQVMLHAWIHVHTTAPTAGGTIEFYLLRADDNATEVRDGEALFATTTAGAYGTAAGVARARNEGELVGVIVVDAVTDLTYRKSFVVSDPGTDWNIMVYNGTGQTLNTSTGTTGSGVNWRSMIPEVQ